MQQALDTPGGIVPNEIRVAADEVIGHVRRNTPYQFLVDAKLGDANSGPIADTELASAHGTAPSTTSNRWTNIVKTLAQADQQHGQPLELIAQRANAVMAAAAIVNRHKRRPPLYSESTIGAFVQLGHATPEHSPLIRAAGYVSPPPATPLSHDIDFVITDIAAHMARSHEPQNTNEILRSLDHRQVALDKWPQLDLTLFIHRTTGITPDQTGLFHSDQPWNRFISSSQLVANTMLRILARDQKPRTTEYLTSEIERLVGHSLPPGYNTLSAVRAAASSSGEVTWHGLSTFGLRKWETAPTPRNIATRRRSTGDLIYTFLTQNGPATVEEIIEHVRRNSKAQKRTVQEAIKRDPANRFIRIHDGRMAANPIPYDCNPDGPAITVIPDGRQQGPALRESELAWLTRFLQGLAELTPPLPCRVALTGPRAAGSTPDGKVEITVVTDERHWSNLELRLMQLAAATSDPVASEPAIISVVSSEEWERQQAGKEPEAHYNIWLAPGTTP